MSTRLTAAAKVALCRRPSACIRAAAAWDRRLFSSKMSAAGERFRIVEVGPRDGLQNERQHVATPIKVELVDRLSASGFQTIETTSFVSPKWVPQLADNNDVLNSINRKDGTKYPVLVPNLAGLQAALKNPNVTEIAVFGATAESFTRKNTNCSMEESLQRIKEVTEAARSNGLSVRGYISMVIADPDEGDIDPNVVASLVERFLGFGCYEVSLGDTIGVGTARSVSQMLDAVLKVAPSDKLAVHFHDTYGQALANVLVAIDKGIRVADSSVAGLGGCNYAVGATGNLATEDLIYMLNDLGFNTGINLDRVIETGNWICEKMGRANNSRAALAILKQKDKENRRSG